RVRPRLRRPRELRARVPALVRDVAGRPSPAHDGKGRVRLAGKVALVTGATKGIGRTIATTFAREGAKVVLVGRTAADGECAQAELTADGLDALYVRADVGDEAAVAAAVRTAVDRFGSLTTLVNNAAATHLTG